MDYAVNRYYFPAAGRFMSPDPYVASGGPADPASWNRYVYTRGDPIGRVDPDGLQDKDCTDPKSDFCATVTIKPPKELLLGWTWGWFYGFFGAEPPRVQPNAEKDQYPGKAGQRMADAAQDKWNDLIRRVQTALADPGCLKVFGNAPDLGSGLFGIGPTPTPGEVFTSLTQNGTYGSIVLGTPSNPNANASTQASGWSVRVVLSSGQIVYTSNTITINNTVDPQFAGSTMWNFATRQDNALTLLHELGHVLSNMGWTGGLFINDDDNALVNRMNDAFVKSNCGSLVN